MNLKERRKNDKMIKGTPKMVKEMSVMAKEGQRIEMRCFESLFKKMFLLRFEPRYFIMTDLKLTDLKLLYLGTNQMWNE